MGVVVVNPPRDYAKKIDPCRMLVWLGPSTVQNMGYHRIGSVHAVIWQAGTNWAGPVRIQIYYGPDCYKHEIHQFCSF